MTEFKIIRIKKKLMLDISELKHIFVTEDETSAEIRISTKDAKRLLRAVTNFLAPKE